MLNSDSFVNTVPENIPGSTKLKKFGKEGLKLQTCALHLVE